MLLEVRYKENSSWSSCNSVYVSLPERYDLDSTVKRIFKEGWLEMAMKSFISEDKSYFPIYNAFKRDFKNFLENKFGITNNNFVGIREYMVPAGIPFLSK